MTERAEPGAVAAETSVVPGVGQRRRGWVLAGVAIVLGGVLGFHRLVPNWPGRVGSLVESFLPWGGALVVVLLVIALVRRSAVALVALLLPVGMWVDTFGGLLLPGEESGGGRELIVVQHNVSDENRDPAGTARALVDSGADLVALEELVDPQVAAYEKALAADYPHHVVRGTVGLWSKHPLSGEQVVDIKPRSVEEGWSRGLRAVVRSPYGDVAAYVAHLPSVRVGVGGLASQRRDESAALLGRAIAGESVEPVILLGDLNGVVEDRGLRPLTSQLAFAESGFAFSFPAAFPLARIDQVMARSAAVGHIRTLPATGSDHLPVVARVTLE
ncbi:MULTISPECIES: endonuclease/exonuclease/phosphatase family protein [unclassified Streptomyces]|uniref:endonuclease/exonuclease/phosphatase family protein n=1 Tax=unclassified Streptomyces TaxID=2593676 RepID=UPI001F258366|nr:MULTISPECIES: endonuclease/exonuclease/phosphatase family protein [unclassified Streptomyces]